LREMNCDCLMMACAAFGEFRDLWEDQVQRCIEIPSYVCMAKRARVL
jgi:hypothetical protein